VPLSIPMTSGLRIDRMDLSNPFVGRVGRTIQFAPSLNRQRREGGSNARPPSSGSRHMRTPEGIEKDKVKAWLTEIGAFHRWPVPYGYGQPHIDCYAAIAGVFWSIEVKAEGEEPTVLQWRTLRETEDAGGKVAWGTAADIIRVIGTWLDRQARGGPVDWPETDPHATAANARPEAREEKS